MEGRSETILCKKLPFGLNFWCVFVIYIDTLMNTNQTKEEQHEVLQKESLTAIETYQLPTFVLCCYLKVMIDNNLCKPNIYDYFTTFPVKDVLDECRTVIDKLMDEHPYLRQSEVYGTALGKIIDLHQDAVEIDTFMDTYLVFPIDEEPSYLNSIERQMNTARQGFNIVDFAYWWSVWNITKVKGRLDNSYWENRNRLTDSELLATLNEFLDIQTAKDSQGNYVYDVFKNPSVVGHDWSVPCEVLHLAIKCLKHFIDLDDLPE